MTLEVVGTSDPAKKEEAKHDLRVGVAAWGASHIPLIGYHAKLLIANGDDKDGLTNLDNNYLADAYSQSAKQTQEYLNSRNSSNEANQSKKEEGQKIVDEFTKSLNQLLQEASAEEPKK